MTDLTAIKDGARKAAFARRKDAFAMHKPGVAGHLSEVLAGYRGVPLSGYMPIRTEIDPVAAMAEAAAHGPVAVPVIIAAGQPLKFSRWQPEAPLRDGPFGALVPEVDNFFDPEILIVPLVAFDAKGGRLGYGGGFYDRTLSFKSRQKNFKNPKLYGLSFNCQEVAKLNAKPWDVRLDAIVTPTTIYQ